MEEKRDFEGQIRSIKKRIWLFNILAWISVVFGLIILIVGLDFLFADEKDFNEVGDFIGGVAGSLWALAGLFFIYIAFLGQKIEIKYQQEDLELTRDELKETKEVFKQQAQIMSGQQLDNTFFNLLDNHRKLVDSFGFQSKNLGNLNMIKGYEALSEIKTDLEEIFIIYSECHRSKKVLNSDVFESNPIDKLKSNSNVKLLHDEVSHILLFIKNRIKKDQQKFYFDTVRHNLNSDEKYLVEAYNYFVTSSPLAFSFNDFNNSQYCNLHIVIKKIDIKIDKKEISTSSSKTLEFNVFRYSSERVTFVRFIILNRNSVISTRESNEFKNINYSLDISEEFDLFKNDTDFFDFVLKGSNEKNANGNIVVFQFEMDGLNYFLPYTLEVFGNSKEYQYIITEYYLYIGEIKEIIKNKIA